MGEVTWYDDGMQRDHITDRQAYVNRREAEARESFIREWEASSGVTREDLLKALEEAYGPTGGVA